MVIILVLVHSVNVFYEPWVGTEYESVVIYAVFYSFHGKQQRTAVRGFILAIEQGDGAWMIRL